MSLLFTIGFVISLLVVIVLMRREELFIPHKFAIGILLLWAIRFLLFYAKENYDLSSVPLLYIIDQNFFFLDGPLLLLYTNSLGNVSIKLKKVWFHFVPFFMALLLTLYTYAMISDELLNSIYQDASNQLEEQTFIPSFSEVVFITFIIIHNIIYAIISLKKVRVYRKAILDNLSTIAKASVDWLSKFIKAWIILLVVPLVIYFANYIYPIVDVEYLETLFITSLTLSAFYFGINLIEQRYVRLFQNIESSSEETNILNDVTTVDNKKELTIKDKEDFKKVISFMETNKPYLEVNLTLNKLAKYLEIKPNKLSYLINNNTEGNFYDFINGYRIKAIKKDLIETNEQIILIAYDNGFNSKSTFNEVFKKNTGLTPSQFRRQHTR